MEEETGITVRELSKQLDVTKQALHKRISQLPTELTPSKVGGAYRLTPEIVEYLKNEMNIEASDSQPDSQLVDNEVDALNRLIDEMKVEKDHLYNQINKKDDQINKKDDQITELQKLVDQQQRLTLYANEQQKNMQLKIETLEEKDQEERPQTKKWWQIWGG